MDESPGLVTGTYNTLRPEIDGHSLDVSALGENFDASLWSYRSADVWIL